MVTDNFNYQSLSEEEEKQDFSKSTACPHCKKPIPHDATMCLYCGEAVAYPGKKRWVVWVAVFLLIAFMGLLLIS